MKVEERLVELPTDYVPSENEEYMNKFQLEYFRRKLINKKNEMLAESNNMLDVLKEESSFSPDKNDCATQENNIMNILQKRERDIQLIHSIDHALQRIANKEYGYCAETGEEIGIKRLEANPLTVLSVSAQEKFEKHMRLYNRNIYNEEVK